MDKCCASTKTHVKLWSLKAKLSLSSYFCFIVITLSSLIPLFRKRVIFLSFKKFHTKTIFLSFIYFLINSCLIYFQPLISNIYFNKACIKHVVYNNFFHKKTTKNNRVHKYEILSFLSLCYS